MLASVIDREPHIWPRMQWDMQDPVASTEFIYGTGELFRSGAAGARDAGRAAEVEGRPENADGARTVRFPEDTDRRAGVHGHHDLDQPADGAAAFDRAAHARAGDRLADMSSTCTKPSGPGWASRPSS